MNSFLVLDEPGLWSPEPELETKPAVTPVQAAPRKPVAARHVPEFPDGFITISTSTQGVASRMRTWSRYLTIAAREVYQ